MAHSHRRAAPAPELSEFDQALLGRLQQHIPLVEEPFAALADELGCDEPALLERARALAANGLIRDTSAIFDARKLGYRSSLVAARYSEDRVHAAAEVISSHPGVSHNYRREHAFNLWYTIAVPPGTSLEGTVDLLHRATGAESTLLLPAIRTFKLGVQLDLASGRQRASARFAEAADETLNDVRGQPPTEDEVRAIRALQRPLPFVTRPFDQLAREEGLESAEVLLRAACRLHERGALRRLASVLRHRRAGFSANAMVAWDIDAERTAELGPQMAAHEMVSHCYERPAYPEWPYRIFTMLHARERQAIDDAIAELEAVSGCAEHVTLYSTEEFKKARVRYFTDAWATWQAPTPPRDGVVGHST
ncbi:MAG: AsnC family transcriptional regulator [Dehalococcoidia bacterium]